MNGLTILISIGAWGGIYAYFKWSWRVCLGWIAITILPVDGDQILDAVSKGVEIERVKAEAQ